MDDIATAVELLAEVRRRDRGHRLFGAATHRYESRPVAEGVLAAYEGRLGDRLPPAYRTFLAEVGAGAGPYYGLWSPDATLAELDLLCGDLASEGLPLPSAARPFPLQSKDVAAGAVHAPHPADGAIPIGDQGCAFWSLLVTAGPWAGTVWDIECDTAYDGRYRPARRPPGVARPGFTPRALPELASPPTVMQWYRGWLERCLADLDR